MARTSTNILKCSYLSIYLSIYHSLSIFLFIPQSVQSYLSIYLSHHIFLSQPVSFNLSIYSSQCVCVCIYIYIYIYIYIMLFKSTCLISIYHCNISKFIHQTTPVYIYIYIYTVMPINKSTSRHQFFKLILFQTKDPRISDF